MLKVYPFFENVKNLTQSLVIKRTKIQIRRSHDGKRTKKAQPKTASRASS